MKWQICQWYGVDRLALPSYSPAMDSTEEIKSRLDIVDLIAEYLPLKPAGAGAYKTNCPFHQERTPSFYVSRNRQSWHCFGCDLGGDQFSFVERMEGMEFREALEFLAQKVGVELPKFDGEKASKKKRLHEVNDLATRFFASALRNLPQAEHARQYVQSRGLDDLSIDLFRIGYAPASWSTMTDALLKRGVTAEELLDAGLVSKRDHGGVYDRFRDRLMFPIADVHGNIVGFTGRILTNDKNPSPSSGRQEAKYMNTPETTLYRKSAVLYGLDKAKGEIRQQDLAVIVEGNMDVVSSHQFSVCNVVAASGTALTVEQLGLIRRFTTNLAIAFDQDSAGKAATIRGLDLARAQDFTIKIITLPPEAGKDPDDAVRKDPQIWKDAIKNAVSIMDWMYRNAFRGRQLEKPEDKKQIARDILPEIKRIADPIERDHWIKKLARELAVGENALLEVMAKLTVNVSPSVGTPRETPAASQPVPEGEQTVPASAIERRVLVSLLAGEGAFLLAKDELKLKPEEFEHVDRAALYAAVLLDYNTAQSIPAAPRLGVSGAIRQPLSLTDEQAMHFCTLAMEAEREFEEGGMEAAKRDLVVGVQSMRQAKKTRERKRLEDEMREAEREGDGARIAELSRLFADLS
ncbi:MAG: DNA primase [Patescibacteria group bacterium]